jgi:hypothetical protein
MPAIPILFRLSPNWLTSFHLLRHGAWRRIGLSCSSYQYSGFPCIVGPDGKHDSCARAPGSRMDEPVFLVITFTWSLPFDCLLHARSSMVCVHSPAVRLAPVSRSYATQYNHLLLAASRTRCEVDHPLIVGIVKLL